MSETAKEVVWINVKKASGILGCSIQTIYRLVDIEELTSRNRATQLTEVIEAEVLARLEPKS